MTDGLGPRLRHWLAPPHPTWQSRASRNRVRAFLRSEEARTSGGVRLNVGSASRRFGVKMLNLDLYRGENVDVQGDLLNLPLKDGSVDSVVCQGVLEHVSDPHQGVAEIRRALKFGGRLFVEAPFMQTVHASPDDYSRWTPSGLRQLLKDFTILECHVVAGPASVLAWQFQETMAMLFSFGSDVGYRVGLRVFGWLAVPLSWLDVALERHPRAWHAASGYAVVAVKTRGGEEGRGSSEDIEARLRSASWQPAGGVGRPFVRYPGVKPSPGTVWQDVPANGAVTLSVVIPTSDASRDGYFPNLLVQIGRQDFRDFELIVVRGDPRQGRAINVGAALAQGKYLLTLDDDTSLPDPRTFSKLVGIMESYPDIGMAGGNNVIPSDASPLVRRVMRQVPRRSWEPVQEIADSDLAEHPCVIMRTAEFKAVGGENELLPRGLDPYLRQAFREAGKRVVVVPEVIYHHLPPDSVGRLLRQFFRNGQQAAFANRHYPQWVIETPSAHGPFRPRVPFRLRVVRFPVRLLRALLTGKPVWFLCQIAYALGFAREWVFPKEQA